MSHIDHNHPTVHDGGGDNSDRMLRPSWLDRAEYPFTLRSTDLPAGPVTYVDEGNGPTLLFVHAGMWSFIFRDVIADLRRDFRCITLDFPGYGLSPDPPDEPAGARRLTWHSDVLASFVDALDLDDITVVAHDLGGSVAMAVAARHPERHRAFVLANTFVWPADTTALRTMLRIVGSVPMTAIGTSTNLVPKLTSGRGGVGRHLPETDRSAFLGPFRDPGRRRRFHQTMHAALADHGLRDDLGRVVELFADRPVLSIFGEKNDPFGFQDRIDSIFDDHEAVVVAGGNHFPMCDDPELFADTVRRWYRARVEAAVPSGHEHPPATLPDSRRRHLGGITDRVVDDGDGDPRVDERCGNRL